LPLEGMSFLHVSVALEKLARNVLRASATPFVGGMITANSGWAGWTVEAGSILWGAPILAARGAGDL
jgi:hypothetical protein